MDTGKKPQSEVDPLKAEATCHDVFLEYTGGLGITDNKMVR